MKAKGARSWRSRPLCFAAQLPNPVAKILARLPAKGPLRFPPSAGHILMLDANRRDLLLLWKEPTPEKQVEWENAKAENEKYSTHSCRSFGIHLEYLRYYCGNLNIVQAPLSISKSLQFADFFFVGLPALGGYWLASWVNRKGVAGRYACEWGLCLLASATAAVGRCGWFNEFLWRTWL